MGSAGCGKAKPGNVGGMPELKRDVRLQTAEKPHIFWTDSYLWSPPGQSVFKPSGLRLRRYRICRKPEPPGGRIIGQWE